MALTDINFQEGEGQDFIVEVPSFVYTGNLNDISIESDGSQIMIYELPEVVGGGGGNIFIMSE